MCIGHSQLFNVKDNIIFPSIFDSLSQIRVKNKDFTFQVIHEKTLCEKRKFLKAFYYKVCDEKMIA